MTCQAFNLAASMHSYGNQFGMSRYFNCDISHVTNPWWATTSPQSINDFYVYKSFKIAKRADSLVRRQNLFLNWLKLQRLLFIAFWYRIAIIISLLPNGCLKYRIIMVSSYIHIEYMGLTTAPSHQWHGSPQLAHSSFCYWCGHRWADYARTLKLPNTTQKTFTNNLGDFIEPPFLQRVWEMDLTQPLIYYQYFFQSAHGLSS